MADTGFSLRMLLRGVAQLVLVLVAVAACPLSTRALVLQLPTSADLWEQVTASGPFPDEGLSPIHILARPRSEQL